MKLLLNDESYTYLLQSGKYFNLTNYLVFGNRKLFFSWYKDHEKYLSYFHVQTNFRLSQVFSIDLDTWQTPSFVLTMLCARLYLLKKNLATSIPLKVASPHYHFSLFVYLFNDPQASILNKAITGTTQSYFNGMTSQAFQIRCFELVLIC